MAEDKQQHLIKLYQSLFEEKLPFTDLFLRLRSDNSTKHGLYLFYLILKRSVSPREHHDHDRGIQKLGFQLWTDSQIQSVTSLGLAVVSACRSLSVEQVEPIVVAVVQQLLEFAVCI
ncbi:protein with unknown function [Ricinus communis]|uniref:Uncharacterized protein n=1 Tax=Ricinus communis TaxID=3988 RepID=B9SIX1_RICCO|nr:protein with unknown function [Ricinus communis]|eukprot:XP_002525940.1 auxin transport protein BIG [Ricinus communis]